MARLRLAVGLHARGREQLRGFFSQVLALFPREGTQLEMKQRIVEGEIAYIVWSALTPVVDVPVGSDTFVVRDGLIVAQTFAGQIIPKHG